MRNVCGYAFKNIWRSRVRSVALLTIITVGVAVLTLIAAGYEDMFYSAAKESREQEGDISFVDHSNDAKRSLSWESYLLLKERLLSTGMVHKVQASAQISGIIGGVDRSAPCSGIAYEGGIPLGEEDLVPIKMGGALAKTLSLAPTDTVGALLYDCGMTGRVEQTVVTEVLLKDRFYVELPLEAFIVREEVPRINSVYIWLSKPLLAPRLYKDSDSPEYQHIVELCSQAVELEGFTLYALPNNNTNVARIVQIYRTNYQVVLVVVIVTLLLAFLNVLTLSVYERQQELGTLRSLGTPLVHIQILIVLETVCIALIGWLIAVALSFTASMIIQAAGGLVFAPPPGETSAITVGSRYSIRAVVETGLYVIGAGCIASLLSVLRLGKHTIVEQLAIRN